MYGSKTIVLTFQSCSHPGCLQVTYLDGPTGMHGTDMGDPSMPAGSVVLKDCEQIVTIYGTSASLVNAIGFNTSLGRVYGPWGTLKGATFAYPGAVYAFFGGEKCGCIGAIGAWVDPPGPPTQPPQPLSPSPPPPPTRGMSKSPLFGAGRGLNRVWDDGPSHTGKLFLPHTTSSIVSSPALCNDPHI
jgi:hypothetical protein